MPGPIDRSTAATSAALSSASKGLGQLVEKGAQAMQGLPAKLAETSAAALREADSALHAAGGQADQAWKEALKYLQGQGGSAPAMAVGT